MQIATKALHAFIALTAMLLSETGSQQYNEVIQLSKNEVLLFSENDIDRKTFRLSKENSNSIRKCFHQTPPYIVTPINIISSPFENALATFIVSDMIGNFIYDLYLLKKFEKIQYGIGITKKIFHSDRYYSVSSEVFEIQEEHHLEKWQDEIDSSAVSPRSFQYCLPKFFDGFLILFKGGSDRDISFQYYFVGNTVDPPRVIDLKSLNQAVSDDISTQKLSFKDSMYFFSAPVISNENSIAASKQLLILQTASGTQGYIIDKDRGFEVKSIPAPQNSIAYLQANKYFYMYDYQKILWRKLLKHHKKFKFEDHLKDSINFSLDVDFFHRNFILAEIDTTNYNKKKFFGVVVRKFSGLDFKELSIHKIFFKKSDSGSQLMSFRIFELMDFYILAVKENKKRFLYRIMKHNSESLAEERIELEFDSPRLQFVKVYLENILIAFGDERASVFRFRLSQLYIENKAECNFKELILDSDGHQQMVEELYDHQFDPKINKKSLNKEGFDIKNYSGVNVIENMKQEEDMNAASIQLEMNEISKREDVGFEEENSNHKQPINDIIDDEKRADRVTEEQPKRKESLMEANQSNKVQNIVRPLNNKLKERPQREIEKEITVVFKPYDLSDKVFIYQTQQAVKVDFNHHRSFPYSSFLKGNLIRIRELDQIPSNGKETSNFDAIQSFGSLKRSLNFIFSNIKSLVVFSYTAEKSQLNIDEITLANYPLSLLFESDNRLAYHVPKVQDFLYQENEKIVSYHEIANAYNLFTGTLVYRQLLDSFLIIGSKVGDNVYYYKLDPFTMENEGEITNLRSCENVMWMQRFDLVVCLTKFYIKLFFKEGNNFYKTFMMPKQLVQNFRQLYISEDRNDFLLFYQILTIERTEAAKANKGDKLKESPRPEPESVGNGSDEAESKKEILKTVVDFYFYLPKNNRFVGLRHHSHRSIVVENEACKHFLYERSFVILICSDNIFVYQYNEFDKECIYIKKSSLTIRGQKIDVIDSIKPLALFYQPKILTSRSAEWSKRKQLVIALFVCIKDSCGVILYQVDAEIQNSFQDFISLLSKNEFSKSEIIMNYSDIASFTENDPDHLSIKKRFYGLSVLIKTPVSKSQTSAHIGQSTGGAGYFQYDLHIIYPMQKRVKVDFREFREQKLATIKFAIDSMFNEPIENLKSPAFLIENIDERNEEEESNISNAKDLKPGITRLNLVAKLPKVSIYFIDFGQFYQGNILSERIRLNFEPDNYSNSVVLNPKSVFYNIKPFYTNLGERLSKSIQSLQVFSRAESQFFYFLTEKMMFKMKENRIVDAFPLHFHFLYSKRLLAQNLSFSCSYRFLHKINALFSICNFIIDNDKVEVFVNFFDERPSNANELFLVLNKLRHMNKSDIIITDYYIAQFQLEPKNKLKRFGIIKIYPFEVHYHKNRPAIFFSKTITSTNVIAFDLVPRNSTSSNPLWIYAELKQDNYETFINIHFLRNAQTSHHSKILLPRKHFAQMLDHGFIPVFQVFTNLLYLIIVMTLKDRRMMVIKIPFYEVTKILNREKESFGKLDQNVIKISIWQNFFTNYPKLKVLKWALTEKHELVALWSSEGESLLTVMQLELLYTSMNLKTEVYELSLDNFLESGKMPLFSFPFYQELFKGRESLLNFDYLGYLPAYENRLYEQTLHLRLYFTECIKEIGISRIRTISIKNSAFRSNTLTFYWSTGKLEKSIEVDLTYYKKHLTEDEIHAQDLKLMMTTGVAILIGLLLPTIKYCCFARAK